MCYLYDFHVLSKPFSQPTLWLVTAEKGTGVINTFNDGSTSIQSIFYQISSGLVLVKFLKSWCYVKTSPRSYQFWAVTLWSTEGVAQMNNNLYNMAHPLGSHVRSRKTCYFLVPVAIVSLLWEVLKKCILCWKALKSSKWSVQTRTELVPCSRKGISVQGSTI